MALISVKAKEGRRVTVAGRLVPTDRYVRVEETTEVRRKLDVWGDLEQEQTAKPADTVLAAKPKTKE